MKREKKLQVHLQKKLKRTTFVSREAIQDVVRRITDSFEVEKVILFGSYAYGAPTEGSDVDLLIVMNHSKHNNRKQMFEVSKALTPRTFPLDIVIRTPKDISNRIPEGDWFLKDIIDKGTILFERAR